MQLVYRVQRKLNGEPFFMLPRVESSLAINYLNLNRAKKKEYALNNLECDYKNFVASVRPFDPVILDSVVMNSQIICYPHEKTKEHRNCYVKLSMILLRRFSALTIP